MSKQILMCAVAYDTTGPSFYFSDMEEYQRKYDEARKAHGCEEYEIQWIDGNDTYARVWQAGPGQSDLSGFFELVETESDHDLLRWVALCHADGLVEYDGSVWRYSNTQVRDGSVEDYVYELLEDGCITDTETLMRYFDVAAFARDLSADGIYSLRLGGSEFTVIR